MVQFCYLRLPFVIKTLFFRQLQRMHGKDGLGLKTSGWAKTRLVSYHLSMSFELEDPFFFLHDEETKVKLTAGVFKDPF